jgi:lipoate-protein ligase A
MPTDIRHLDWSLPQPAANLAWDEALLNDCETRGGPGLLRFWESSSPFIVMGYAARAADEVNLEACRQLAIPVLRRCSGGGTVLQGPGCLNYSLILPLSLIHEPPEAATITATNRFVMERHRSALAHLLSQPVAVAGHTDLVLGDRKFSGNAQRRRRHWFLFHGTFLHQVDLSLMQQLLSPPARQPEYRQQRAHADFLTTIPASSDALRSALRRAWRTTLPADPPPPSSPLFAAVEELVRLRYGNEQWNLR